MSTSSNAIVWLHLSDLHLCEPKTGWDAHSVLDPLIEDLKTMEAEHGLLPQLLFFTGDAAFGSVAGASLSKQYQEVETFLSRVREAFSQTIPKDNVFLVPGNHDVDRDEVTEQQIQWLDQQTNADKIIRLIQEGKKDWRQYMERLATYRQFLEANGYSHLLRDPERLLYAQVREIQGVKIGIGGFNSAWSCGRNGENGKLWLGGNWQKGTIVGSLKKQQADLKLALIHHPPSWFVEYEKTQIQSFMEKDFDFFLHGHEHQGWVNAINNEHVRIAAAACYERADQENGYNLVRLNLDTGAMEIWLRKFDNDGGGWIPRIIAKKTDKDGCWHVQALPCLLKLTKKTAESSSAFVSNDDFTLKVREQIKQTLNTKKPAAEALRGALLKGQAAGAEPEDILLPLDGKLAIDACMGKWLQVVTTVLQSAREPLADIKQCATEIMGWLVLLSVDGGQLPNYRNTFMNFDEVAEIVVPVKTEAGTEVFVARMQEKSAKFRLQGTNKAMGGNHLDPHELELGFLHDDRLRQIEALVYAEVFKTQPKPNEAWLETLKHYLEIGALYQNQLTYLSLSSSHHSAHLPTIKQLKADLPHLRVIIKAAKEEGGNSILIMDESKLEAFVLRFLNTLAES